jgi:hypothetical protein
VLFLTTALLAQAPDLTLQKDITPQYMAYLDSMETEFLKLLPGADDAQTMKAHVGLAIIQAARIHVNGDTLTNDLDNLLSGIEYNTYLIVNQTFMDIFPLFNAGNPNEFVLNLTEFFKTGTYPAYRDSVLEWLSENSLMADSIGGSIDYFGSKVDPLLNALGDHWVAVMDNTADFEFNVRTPDTLFVFSRIFFDRQEMIIELGDNMANKLGEGFASILDSVNNNSPDIDPGVAIVQAGFDSLNALIDSLQVLLSEQPFSPLELNLAWMDSLQNVIAEADTLLGGKTYPIGPESENKVIRPRGIIESLAHHDGPMGVFKDYYRGGEQSTYTFYNTFPNGLTSDMYAMIASDIILNANDTREQFETKLHAYQTLLLLKEASPFTPLTPDEHLGLALTLLYDLLNDSVYFGNIESVFEIISMGRIDSLLAAYEWSDFDLQDEIDVIRYHVDQYINSEETTNYVILIKTSDDGLDSYTLGAASEFQMTFLSVTQIEIATGMIDLACQAMSAIGDVLKGFYNELDRMFILELDPTYLNFSSAEEPLDIINILKQSNPEFMTVTPYGIEKFHEMGDWLKDSFESFGIFFDNLNELFVAMEPYQADFDMNAPEMEMMAMMSSTMAWGLYQDFAYPDSTIRINGERVNISAWFDNPPVSFLTMMENFFLGTDSTMGGMFPDRFKVGIAGKSEGLPTEFKLYPVYPNPFNPITNIEFDLPQTANVKVCVIDIQGRMIEQIVNRQMAAGRIALTWNAARYPSGIYFATVDIDGRQTIRKMTLLK